MATLNLKPFTTLVSDQVAAIQARSASLLDFTIGSVLRALVEANSGVVLWLESLVLQVLAATRAATSTGSDLDTFVGDFGLTRLTGAVSSGSVTFSRFTPAIQAVVPVGAQLQTSDGTQKFIVVADNGNAYYNAGQGGYVIPINTASAPVTVNSVAQSASANVQPNTISVLQTAIPGIDLVTNPSATTAGQDPETDAALRKRFRAYIAALAKATTAAISYAIMSVQAGLYFSIVETIDYATGAPRPGYFFVILDDGTGTPSDTLIDNVYTAVDAVRAAGVQFAVYPPVEVLAYINMTITTGAGYDHPTICTTVQGAIETFVNALPVGAPLALTKLYQVAYDASPGVMNVSSVTINSGTADLAIAAGSVIKTSTVLVV